MDEKYALMSIKRVIVCDAYNLRPWVKRESGHLRTTMRKTIVSVFAAVSAFGLAGAAPASAAEGVNEVVVYSHEFSPLDVYENPQGCHALPLAAHQLNNRTDKVVSIYQDPLCLTSSQVQVPPGHGAHVMPGSGSFSLSE